MICPIRFYLIVELCLFGSDFTPNSSSRSKLPYLGHFFAKESDIKVCGASKHGWEENH